MVAADDDMATLPAAVFRPASLISGIAYGLTAAVLVYLSVVVLLAIEMLGLADGRAGGLEAVAFLLGSLGDFYGAHAGATSGLALGIRGVGGVPAVLYYGLPFVVLGWAGFQRESTDTDPTRAAARGATVVAGYAPAVVASLLVVARFDALVGVDPLRVVVVAGLCYPMLVGAAGGYLATVVGDEKS